MERKTTDRKKVDAMLVELEAFVAEFGDAYPSVKKLFSVEFRRNAPDAKNVGKSHDGLDLPRLSILSNSWSQSYVKMSAKHASEDEKRRTVRKSQFVQRVAYGMKMTSVPELDYRHFFFKFCIANGCYIAEFDTVHHGFIDQYRGSFKEILVPEEWAMIGNSGDLYMLY